MYQLYVMGTIATIVTRNMECPGVSHSENGILLSPHCKNLFEVSYHVLFPRSLIPLIRKLGVGDYGSDHTANFF